MSGGWFRLPLPMLVAASVGMAAPASAPPSAERWSADPEAQFLLDLQIRQRAFGDGVRAYPVPEGTCVILGDLITALDLPIRIDLAARRAEGWAFRESNRLVIDRVAARVSYGTGSEPLPAGAVRDAPEGWCVESGALSRWLGLPVQPRTDASLLLLESKDKLPIEMAMERRERASRLTRATIPIDSLPRVRLPYRMWRTPSVDVMLDGGVAWSAQSGTRIDHRASILAAGEALQMSYEARIATDQRGLPTNIRLRAFRSDPDGGLLGPLKATHVAVGDVEIVGSPLALSSGSGRGAVVTNRPLFRPVAFDRTQFSGELPVGWDAELYRNGELVAFAAAGSDGRYRFDDVALGFGDNRFEILSYGPQGQVRSRIENLTVGPEAVPPGDTHYWLGVVDPGSDLLDFRKRDGPSRDSGWRATASVEHGLDRRTSLAALVQTLSVDDERVTYVEGTVRRSIGPAIAELAVARDSKGGLALRGQALARIGAVNLSWSSFWSRDFAAQPEGVGASAEHRFSVDAPVKLGSDMILPLHGDIRIAERRGGGRSLEANGRTSIMLSRFNLASMVRWRDEQPGGGLKGRREAEVGLIGSGRIGPVRVRGTTEWEIHPGSRLRRAELSGYWSRGGNADWEAALAYERQDKGRARARLSHIRRFDQFAVAGSIEAASDGSVAAGLNLNFSLDRGPGGWRFSRQSLAGTGSVRAQLFRDANGNGLRDSGEKVEEGAVLTAGLRPADRPSGRDGWASVAGLDNYRPIAIGVDASSLSDPNLVPLKPAQVVVPRPGVSAELLIPLTGGGAIEGVLLKDGGGSFEGLDLELVDAAGKVVATAGSDYDGFFLFERVPPGRYSLRLSGPSAVLAKSDPQLTPGAFELKPEQAVLRLGSLVVKASPKLAVNQDVVLGDLRLAN
ncbi:collagen binding domain-containing protein [Sphingomonas sp. LHG3406-1]|uniref:MSCRAMM family protein n=1 Tax=Sphingomonas sp. LHG3406-1 TaxID=2804617 RepID=UPI00261137FC|nr:carboxypeptidase-like regulatory domain-containing protein [Sphingomonas sp. LHG3406-1]